MEFEFEFEYKGKQFRARLGEKPRYIQVDDGNGPITRYEIRPTHIDWDEKIITVPFIPQLLDTTGEIRATSQIDAFSATTQEDWDYFYNPARTGEQIEKMMINGLAIHLFKFLIFDPATGEYTGPVSLIEEPIEEIPAEENI